MTDEQSRSGGHITLRYWASLRAAAGAETDELEVERAVTLTELTRRALDLHKSRRFADVLSVCSVLVDEQPASSHDPGAVMVRVGQTVEFLPPFAGG